MKYLIAIVLLVTLIFTYTTCMEKDKYTTVEIDECEKLQHLITDQTEPTKYLLPSNCQLTDNELPIIINKSNTIIDGSGITISGEKLTDAPSAFILTKKNIILANMTIVDFAKPVQVHSEATSFLYNIFLQGDFESALVVGNSEEPAQPPNSIENPNEQESDELIELFKLPIKSAYADTSTCIAAGLVLGPGNDETIEAEHTTEICNGGISGSGEGTGVKVNGGTLQIGTTFAIRDVDLGIFMSANGGAISIADGITSIKNTNQYGLGLNNGDIQFGTGAMVEVSHNSNPTPPSLFSVCIKDSEANKDMIGPHVVDGRFTQRIGTDGAETAPVYACRSCTEESISNCAVLSND